MDCAEATTLLSAYVDGETSTLEQHSIGEHLHACPTCAASHGELLALRAQIRADVPRYSAPPELRTRVLTMVDAVRASVPSPARAPPTKERWRWSIGGALAGCAATVLAWFVGTAVLDWRANEDLAVEAVTSHTRATLGNQLIQIASSDQHTVKPWLSARLDYSPPVHDYANEGFTLIGGRLDTLDQRPVATLVYRYRQHTIDVFVRPAPAHAPPAPLRPVRGFNVAHASGSGMDWLAVSDVAPDVLSAFVERLARADASP